MEGYKIYSRSDGESGAVIATEDEQLLETLLKGDYEKAANRMMELGKQQEETTTTG